MCRFIVLKDGDNCTPFTVQKVIRFEGCGSYTNIFLINGISSRQCGYLGDWYEKVKSSGLFIRIDRSHLVNYHYVITFNRSGVLMEGNTMRLPLSPRGFTLLQGIFFSGENPTLV